MNPYESLENDLVLVSLVCISDPIKDGVKESIQICRQAGINVFMITGDHDSTALSVGRDIGLIDN